MPAILLLLNLVAGVIFVALGLKGYVDFGGWPALWILGGTVLFGWLLAWLLPRGST